MAGRRRPALAIRRLRSAISNGTRVLADCDHRGPEMRRLRDLLGDFHSDISDPSNAERILISRASMLTLLAEMTEAKFMRAKLKVPTEELLRYLRTVQALRRVLATVGLERRAKPVEDLEAYLKRKYPAKDAVIDAEPAEAAE